jgi:hypothetical protein
MTSFTTPDRYSKVSQRNGPAVWFGNTSGRSAVYFKHRLGDDSNFTKTIAERGI